MKNEINTLGTSGLRLPLQVAPVERRLLCASSLSGDAGLQASFSFGDFLKGVVSNLPSIVSGIGSIASLF